VKRPNNGVGIVLVGGKGTRLGDRTKAFPKPLITVGGRPFLAWVLASLKTTGIRRFVLAAGHHADAVRAFAAERPDVTVVVEPSPLGTAGAVGLAATAVPDADPLLVANGDSIVAASLAGVRDRLDADTDAVLVAVSMGAYPRFGRLSVRDGLLRRIDEKVAGDGPINAGIYILRRELVMDLPAARAVSLETEVLPAWLASGKRIRVLTIDAPFIDIGVPESLARADAFVDEFVRTKLQL